MSSQEYLNLALEFAKVLIWPFLIACVLYSYRRPIRRLLESFVDKFAAAYKVNIGSLSLEIQEHIRTATSPELARQIGTLSPSAIAQLLRVPHTGKMILLTKYGQQEGRSEKFGKPTESQLAVLAELEERGLITFSPERWTNFRRHLKSYEAEPSSAPGSHRPFVITTAGRSADEIAVLREEGYELTREGRLATEAIIAAVASLVQAE